MIIMLELLLVSSISSNIKKSKWNASSQGILSNTHSLIISLFHEGCKEI